MSARDEIYEGLEGHACCYTEEDAAALLDRHEREVLRKAAEKIRANVGWSDMSAVIHGARWAADLIDPGPEQ